MPADPRYGLGPCCNIFGGVLPEGIYYPDYVSLEDERPPEFVAWYNPLRTKPWRDCTILDLGCGEGTGTTAIARTGAHVIGLEGRPEVVRRAEYLRDRLGYTNVEFRVGNVLDPANWPDVDAVFASGLIHHLQYPFELMQLLGRHCREFVYFCTHLDPGDEAARQRSHFASSLFDAGSVDFNGKQLPGVKFRELEDVRETHGVRRRHQRAGVGNIFSWWPTAASFDTAMAATGFTTGRRITGNDRRLRYRLCFTRGQEIPGPGIDAGTYALPTPERPPLRVAATRALAADTKFLQDERISPALIGAGQTLAMTLDHFAKNGIEPGIIYGPDGADMSAFEAFAQRLSQKVEIRAARTLPEDQPPYIIIAADDFALMRQYYNILMTLEFCKYAFTSFSLMAIKQFPELFHPVTGEALPRRNDPMMNY